jgi:phage shock protein PspC (stress-responsive transcriptional regulator)
METTETIRETRRLTRPRDGRWLGGVSAGLGAYFDLSPAIYRIAFVALALAGGTGVLLYVAAWLVIPDEGEADSIAATALKRNRERPSRAVGMALVAFVAVIALSSAHVWPSPGNLWLAAALGVAALVWWQMSQDASRSGGRARSLFPVALGVLVAAVGLVSILDLTSVTNVDWRIVIGAMVVVTGSLIAVGATTGRAVGGLIALTLALLLALGLALAVREPLFAGVGKRTAHPIVAASVGSKYAHGIGDFTVNLADVDLPRGETHVKATLGIGDLTVLVPAGVAVVVDGRVSAGETEIFGHSDDGTGVHEHVRAPGAGTARTLFLDARVGLGQLEVRRG